MGVILIENEVKKFDDTIDEFYTDDYIKSNFPRSFIKDEFQYIISEALQIPEGDRPKFIDAQVGDLRSKLKKSIKEFIFIIPISNLKIENNFSVGNVTFKKFDEVKNKINEIINPDEDEKLQEGIESRCEYLENTCAEVVVKGVPIFAQTKAFTQVRFAVNSLKLYNYPDDPIWGLKYPDDPIWGLKGETLRSEIRTTFYYEDNRPDPEWKLLSEWINPREFELTSERIDSMNKHHFSEIDEILNKTRNNDFETRLLTSIYWFGESLNTSLIEEEDMIYKNKKRKHQNLEYFRLGERLIKLFTALEAILIFDKTDPITDCILKRTPLLITDDPDQINKYRTYLEKLYEKRSQIIHYGNTAVSQQDVLNLTCIVRTIIFALLEIRKIHEFKKGENLKEYLNGL